MKSFSGIEGHLLRSSSLEFLSNANKNFSLSDALLFMLLLPKAARIIKIAYEVTGRSLQVVLSEIHVSSIDK